MRLEWLEDILAVVETGSFSAAAERRFVTQPAFSRRIRVIEEHIGAELFDRDRKPVVLKPLAHTHQEEFRRLVADMKDLLSELRRQGRKAHNRVVIACQHALSATLAPALVGTLFQALDTSVRLRSANRDECLALLMTKQADILLHYQTDAEAMEDPGQFVERVTVGEERLLPVVAAARRREVEKGLVFGELPIIAYPGDTFLGRVFKDELLGLIPGEVYLYQRVETGLTIAALEFALNGIGVAWLPGNLAQEGLRSGRLTPLDDLLPATGLSISAMRLADQADSGADRIWAEVCRYPGARPLKPASMAGRADEFTGAPR